MSFFFIHFVLYQVLCSQQREIPVVEARYGMRSIFNFECGLDSESAYKYDTLISYFFCMDECFCAIQSNLHEQY